MDQRFPISFVFVFLPPRLSTVAWHAAYSWVQRALSQSTFGEVSTANAARAGGVEIGGAKRIVIPGRSQVSLEWSTVIQITDNLMKT